MSEKYPSQLAERFQIRMPDGLRDRVRRHAEANNRSMNAEIVSLLESGLWEADNLRMQNGLEPLREMTDDDQKHLAYYREIIKRENERKANPPPTIADIDIPFFEDGPSQREIFDRLFEHLERIEKKLDRK